MFLKQPLLSWAAIIVLLLPLGHLTAQCVAPAALWVTYPQYSTAMTLNWPVANGATQYQVRYWKTSVPGDKTIVESFSPAPALLSGLKRYTNYTVEIRSKCGNTTSGWANPINFFTPYSEGTCSKPAGVTISTGPAMLTVNWTSSGSHTIRYRLGDSGDWVIPTGALSAVNSPFTLGGLAPGTYQVEIKHNCDATVSDFLRYSAIVTDVCNTPIAPVVIPATTSASVILPVIAGVTGYNVDYRQGISGTWINSGMNIPPSLCYINPPFVPNTQYQVRIQVICNSGISGFSGPATFTTLAASASCLTNKNYGKNLNTEDIALVNASLNRPSPFTFGSMIGVNDGGLNFRSFQNVANNQITQLTTQLRNFHTVDEDFDGSIGGYDQNIKPKDTYPEGTPGNTAHNKGFYNKYRNTHGFSNITATTELLHYGPQSWKDKIYKESDWSLSGPAGIKTSFENYTKNFIDAFAPANGGGSQILVSNFQVGNELWDYPVKSDYHSLLIGARNAFVSKYGQKSGGQWKMKLVVGAFQAYRDGNCTETLRDVSNCGGNLSRHDFIGDYLDLTDCNVLKDLDAIDCHPYSFLTGTVTWTYPENPVSEAGQIRNLAGWLQANKNPATGILQNTRLWSSEYGYDSNPVTGVGEKTQSAYLIRGLLLHSRFHFEKVFFYNAFDHSRPTDPYYTGLYGSSGFWKQGTHPGNSAWPSPLPAHGATPKPSWFGMMDLKTRFGEHVFFKAVVEDAELIAFLIAKPDSTDPYLVFWSPQQTTDANINTNISVSKTVTWSGLLPEGYKLEGNTGRTFSETGEAGQTFTAASIAECGFTILTAIRRNPAFIRLSPCLYCPNITNAGAISAPNPNNGTSPFDPALINNTAAASGGTGGNIVYQWQQSFNGIQFMDIPGATDVTYNPQTITQTTFFRRGAKRSTCTEMLYTSHVTLFITTSCPTVLAFNRLPNLTSGCNSAGDYYYDLVLNGIVVNDEITISGLPGNGLAISASSLNGAPFNTASFNANLQYVNANTFRWFVNTGNGATQTLRITYCWANNYPNPVSSTIARSLCSGSATPCSGAFRPDESTREDRNEISDTQYPDPFRFTVHPNPGTDHVVLTYFGNLERSAHLRMVSATGQLVSTRDFSELEDRQQLQIEVNDLPKGIYFLCLQTSSGVRYMSWEKI